MSPFYESGIIEKLKPEYLIEFSTNFDKNIDCHEVQKNNEKKYSNDIKEICTTSIKSLHPLKYWKLYKAVFELKKLKKLQNLI